jgi:hypothetical protein
MTSKESLPTSMPPFITNVQLGFNNLTTQLQLPNVSTRTAAASFIDLAGLQYLSSGDVSMRPLVSNDPFEITSPLIPGLSLSSFTPSGFGERPPMFAQNGPSSQVDAFGLPVGQQTVQSTGLEQSFLGIQSDPFGLGVISPTAMLGGIGQPMQQQDPLAALFGLSSNQSQAGSYGRGGAQAPVGSVNAPLVGAIVQSVVQSVLPSILQSLLSSGQGQGQMQGQGQLGSGYSVGYQLSQQPYYPISASAYPQGGGYTQVGGAIYPQSYSMQPNSIYGYQQPTTPYLTGMPSVRY